ncbi:MAG: protein phosphatase 2C domain-containing protein [Acidobacteriota bacterium]
MRVTFGYVTDRGLNPRRTRNEDNLLVLPERGLYLVADGVGGRRGGETASRTVVEVFRRVFNQPQFIDDHRAVLLSTIDLCNQKIYEDSQSQIELEGMATTVAVVAVNDRMATIAHVGDSRVYRVDAQGLVRLTEDHSEIHEALRAGRITEELAANHPKRNVINRALGADSEVEPDLIEIELDETTTLLLCTDGVTRHIGDEQLEALLQSGHHPQAICQMIRERCYDGGAEDNLTAIVVDFGRRLYAESATTPALSGSASGRSGVGAPTGDETEGEDWDHEDQPEEAADGVGQELVGRRSTREIDRFELQVGPRAEDVERRLPDLAFEQGPYDQAFDHKFDHEDDAADDLPEDGLEDVEVGEREEYAEEEEPVEAEALPAGRGGWMANLRWSLLVAGIAIGTVFGWLVGPPIVEKFNELFGAQTIYDVKGVEHPPRDPQVNAAYALHLNGKSGEAKQRLESFLQSTPGHAEALLFLGLIEYEEGLFDESRKHLQAALKNDPTLPNIRVRLALTYCRMGQTRNAADILQEIVGPRLPRGVQATPSPTAPEPSPSPIAAPAGGRNPVG